MSDLASRITRPDQPSAAASVGQTQGDGAPAAVDDGTRLADSSYDVEVKLSEQQADTDNPFSTNVQSFDELGL